MESISRRNTSRINIDITLLITAVLLSTLGVINLLSTKILPLGGFSDLDGVYKQIVFLIIGFVLYFIITKLELSYLKYWQVLLILYVVTILLLVATLLFAPTINNVKRWLVIGGFQLQASEIAKLTVILITASIISMKEKYNQWILMAISLLLTLPMVVLIYLQPNGSISILILALWFLISFLGLTNPIRNTLLSVLTLGMASTLLIPAIIDNANWYLLAIPSFVLFVLLFYAKKISRMLIIMFASAGLILGIVSSVIWDNVLLQYQKDRIAAFIEPAGKEDSIGFNVNQSRIAVGSGQIVGKGFGNGTQSKRDFLPEHETDFIFASFAEEFGMVGSLLLMGMYGVVITICFMKSMSMMHNQAVSLIALGIGLQILLQVFINIGTNLGTIPATGIPLPLMSVGGSATIMTLLSLGIIQNIHNSVNNDLDLKKKEILEVYE